MVANLSGWRQLLAHSGGHRSRWFAMGGNSTGASVQNLSGRGPVEERLAAVLTTCRDYFLCEKPNEALE